MALSTDEENKVREIIEAFTNGKRLSDLPDVSGNNPFKLLCEVLEDGESKKAALAAMLPYMEENCMYGIEYDVTVSSPDVTRIGNMSLHKSLPVHNRMKGCLLDVNGNVVEYLNPSDWTGQTRDGSRGQVMVELPMYYRKFETEGNKRRVKFSEYPLPGYHQVKKKYVSAYEASVQRSTTKLCSVVNDGADYRGGGNQSDWDNTYRSVLGRPATSISRTNFRAYARKRKPSTKEWNCMTYDIQKDIYWLFAVEYATLNSQKAYNAEKTATATHKAVSETGLQHLTAANGTRSTVIILLSLVAIQMNSVTEQAKKNTPCPLNMTLLQRKSKCAVIVVLKTRLGIFGSGRTVSTFKYSQPPQEG